MARLSDSPPDENLAAWNGNHLAGLRVELLGRSAHYPNVGRLGMGCGVCGLWGLGMWVVGCGLGGGYTLGLARDGSAVLDAHLGLAARIRAARPVDAKLLWHLDPRVHLLHDPFGGRLGLNEAEWAELRTRARNHVADDVAGLNAKGQELVGER